MARPTTKDQLLRVANDNYNKLMELINSMNEEVFNTPFDFSYNNKKEAHWGRDKNIRDILIHLYEWHCLLLNWINSNENGEAKAFLPAPYNWRNYGEMNIGFFKRHQETSYDKSREIFEKSHKEVMEMLNRFSSEELFTKGVFTWVGGSTLGSYFTSATSSHYDWAVKKIKLHIKNCK